MWLGGRYESGRSAKGMGDVSNELAGHINRGQLKVHHLRGHRTARHAVKFARVGALRHDHAAFTLDGPHAQRAIAAGA